jgi:hypothetical protein
MFLEEPPENFCSPKTLVFLNLILTWCFLAHVGYLKTQTYVIKIYKNLS